LKGIGSVFYIVVFRVSSVYERAQQLARGTIEVRPARATGWRPESHRSRLVNTAQTHEITTNSQLRAILLPRSKCEKVAVELVVDWLCTTAADDLLQNSVGRRKLVNAPGKL
jgi:hypothetical protein